MTTAHLSDDQLIEACYTGTSAETAAHLDACARCAARRGRLASMLSQVTETLTVQADRAFPADRLARQQARILQRIEQEGRPARVIAFPAASTADVPDVRTRPAVKWLAGAAAAGLVLGLLAEHLSHELRPFPAGPVDTRATLSPTNGQPQARRASVADDTLLGEVESAIARPGPSILRTLHDLTPE